MSDRKQARQCRAAWTFVLPTGDAAARHADFDCYQLRIWGTSQPWPAAGEARVFRTSGQSSGPLRCVNPTDHGVVRYQSFPAIKKALHVMQRFSMSGRCLLGGDELANRDAQDACDRRQLLTRRLNDAALQARHLCVRLFQVEGATSDFELAEVLLLACHAQRVADVRQLLLRERQGSGVLRGRLCHLFTREVVSWAVPERGGGKAHNDLYSNVLGVTNQLFFCGSHARVFASHSSKGVPAGPGSADDVNRAARTSYFVKSRDAGSGGSSATHFADASASFCSALSRSSTDIVLDGNVQPVPGDICIGAGHSAFATSWRWSFSIKGTTHAVYGAAADIVCCEGASSALQSTAGMRSVAASRLFIMGVYGSLPWALVVKKCCVRMVLRLFNSSYSEILHKYVLTNHRGRVKLRINY